ncbi:MAG: tRNA (guanosine(46)-N7)-methyltransferase TrmB [Candidatus Hydrogenedentota bacterium]|nr:MAG: tRNA (guanosine(46)-N7)-methyltransferase TrmB [Candidatus Hydrogenedentota bacterium]
MSLVQEKPELFSKLAGILQRKSFSEKEFPSYLHIPFHLDTFPLDAKKIARQYGFQKTVLEIGSGWGEFTLDLAKQNPDWLIVATEKKKHRVKRTLQNALKQNIKNIRMMVLDVTWFLQEVFAPSSFDYVILNFPDPWPKKRHHKHRIMSENFLLELAPLCTKAALLEFATDYWPYMERVLEILQKSAIQKTWRNVHGMGVILPELANRPKSYFELLKKEEGEQPYFLQLLKTQC